MKENETSLENSFRPVRNWAWISSPMTTSHPSSFRGPVELYSLKKELERRPGAPLICTLGMYRTLHFGSNDLM